MKKFGLYWVIILSIIFSMLLFSALFITQSYTHVKKQLSILQQDKITSIAKTITPLIAINMTLEIPSAYEDAVEKALQTHSELINIAIFDIHGKLLYQAIKEKKNDQNGFATYREDLINKISNNPLGNVLYSYTLSKVHAQIMENYQSFLIVMSLASLSLIVTLGIFIRHALKPLRALTQKMASYQLGETINIEHLDGQCETAVINNTAKEMLERIKSNHEELLQREKSLAHQSRLAAMGEMIENIAHQWRQPLMNINAVMMNIDMAYEFDKLTPELLEKEIAEVSTLTLHMSQTIEAFKNFFKPNKDRASFEVDDVITDALELLNLPLKGTRIDFDIKAHPVINSYQNELLQVIISILNNSLDIFKQRNIDKKIITIQLDENEHEVTISIEDNAGGIDDQIIERVFEPYFTTKYKSGGTGLGLYICTMIVRESLHGSIEVTNGVMGACFSIHLNKEK